MAQSIRKKFRLVTFSGSDVTLPSRCAANTNLGTARVLPTVAESCVVSQKVDLSFANLNLREQAELVQSSAVRGSVTAEIWQG